MSFHTAKEHKCFQRIDWLSALKFCMWIVGPLCGQAKSSFKFVVWKHFRTSRENRQVSIGWSIQKTSVRFHCVRTINQTPLMLTDFVTSQEKPRTAALWNCADNTWAPLITCCLISALNIWGQFCALFLLRPFPLLSHLFLWLLVRLAYESWRSPILGTESVRMKIGF